MLTFGFSPSIESTLASRSLSRLSWRSAVLISRIVHSLIIAIPLAEFPLQIL